MEEIEVWRDIPGYEGYYQASSFGRIKSLERIVLRRIYGIQPVFERILKQGLSRGRYTVVLCKDKERKSIPVHKLVAITFLGHTQCGYKLVVNHIDGDGLNNELSNLEVVTQRQNSSVCFRKNKESFTSKYIGVCRDRTCDRWVATIYINGRTVYLGLFKSELEASNAYQKALSEL